MHMKTASVLSTALHIAVLGWATLSFSGKEFESAKVEAMPIDVVSVKEFSEMTKGVKEAPKVAEKPKPVVEKVAPQPPVEPADDLKPKISEKQEVTPNKEAAPPPEPEKQPDQIADKIKDEQPKEAMKTEPMPMPPRKPPVPKPQPKLDYAALAQAALLDKRDPTRRAQTGEQLNADASKGTATGSSSTLSASEISMLMARLRDCWDVPAGIAVANQNPIPITIFLNPDGSLARQPTIDVQLPPGAMQIIAESAMRAILKCAPYKMFRQSNYEAWRQLPLGFDPKFMSGT